MIDQRTFSLIRRWGLHHLHTVGCVVFCIHCGQASSFRPFLYFLGCAAPEFIESVSLLTAPGNIGRVKGGNAVLVLQKAKELMEQGRERQLPGERSVVLLNV